MKCGDIPEHGGYPCYLTDGHPGNHTDGHTTWHAPYPDAHAALTDKLRALVKEWEEESVSQQDLSCDVRCGDRYRYSAAGMSKQAKNCARELSALIDGAK